MIEHSIDNKKKKERMKIDKKLLLIEIYGSLFGNLSPSDCDMLSKNIEFLIDNGHIFRQPTWKVCAYGVVDWLKRKILWMIQYIKDYITDKIQDWLVNQFLNQIKASKTVRTIVTIDLISIVNIILTKYGLSSLTSYVFLLSFI